MRVLTSTADLAHVSCLGSSKLLVDLGFSIVILHV